MFSLFVDKSYNAEYVFYVNFPVEFDTIFSITIICMIVFSLQLVFKRVNWNTRGLSLQ